jgi:hypothetical protein
MKQLLLTLPDDELLLHRPMDAALWIDGQRLPRLMEFTRRGQTLSWSHEGSSSGTVHMVASLPGLGPLVLHTSILMLRNEPYRLAVELVRGQANKLRNIRVEWERDGWRASESLEARSRELTSQLCHCLHGGSDPKADERAIATLIETIRVGEEMAHEYGQWALRERLAGDGKTSVGLTLPSTALERSEVLRDAESLDVLAIPIDWNQIRREGEEDDWSSLDRDVDAALAAGVTVRLGPILDFSADRLPSGLAHWYSDPATLLMLLIDLVETVVHRYADRVQHWVVTHRTNSTEVIPLSDHQREWLTAKLWVTAHEVQPQGRFAIGVDQPWGWYAGQPGRHVWPVEFLDSTLRQGIQPAGILVDFHPGEHRLEPPRTVIDVIKVLSRYRRLDTPLWVGLTGPFGPTATVDRITRGVLAKPFVEQITWDGTEARDLLLSLAARSNTSTERGLAR